MQVIIVIYNSLTKSLNKLLMWLDFNNIMSSLPPTSPFSPEIKPHIEALISQLSTEQKFWLSGFLASMSSGAASAPASSAAKIPLTVLYGTESGNSESLADRVAKTAKQKGFKPTVLNMSEITPKELEGTKHLLVVVSTWGDGDPPEAAETFCASLLKDSFDYSGLEFSVCALGDTSYELFCATGLALDKRLAELGGKRLADCVSCDVDFEESFDAWSDQVWSELGSLVSVATAPTAEFSLPAGFGAASAFDKKNPFPSELTDKVLLNSPQSAKETWHYEFSLEGSGLTYEVGDALAVIPHNDKVMVDAVLAATGLKATDSVTLKKAGDCTLEVALTQHLDITALSKNVVKKYQELTQSADLAILLSDTSKDKYREFVNGREIVDLLELYPSELVTAQGLVNLFRGMPPRLYSIASSIKAHPDEVHLTVASVRYETQGKERKGVASTFLADDLKVGDKASVYVHTNKNFRIPTDNQAPMIMVGPGTGVAPFRAFVEERAEIGAEGKNWLLFGDQRYLHDFLYQLEWQDALKSGALTRLDVAFSRDQPSKRYVQHVMLEQAADIYAYLQEGGYFYVCGDATLMADDVHNALAQIVEQEGNMSAEQAAEYLTQLKKDKRYQRDVY